VLRTLLVPIPVAAILLLMSGCDEEENRRLAEMAERQLQRQAEQSRQMNELHQEVAAGSRRLVEADAKARGEMVVLQREMQVERTEIGRQRDVLEDERRQLATQRQRDPLIAAAITQTGILLVCALPLFVAIGLLFRRVEPADDQAVAEVLLQDLVAEQPLIRLTTTPALAQPSQTPRLTD
jgi:hypothetical protein